MEFLILLVFFFNVNFGVNRDYFFAIRFFSKIGSSKRVLDGKRGFP